ncbi:endonuclease/exonuclease/phosphatase family protein [Baekduia sp. Peel2402]|uniref:endonuclease/exonuclease/phosphatase family protein n=1 Tax=Baekduia sp. Peel2402 TaxID=3458296 RepID=UPI00403EEC95
MQHFEGPRRSRALGRWAVRLLVIPWLVWAIIRTFGLEGGTRLVPLMTFSPYVGLASFIPLVVALVARRWVVAGVALVVCLAFAFALLPRALAGPQPEVDGPQIRVMTANLFVGAGDAREVVRLVRKQDVDVLALEELTPEALARLDAAGLKRLLPHRDADARPGDASGSGLFSRLPIEQRKPYNTLNRNAEPRALVRVPGARPIDVQVIHPPPPIHGWTPIWRHMLSELPRPGEGELRMLAGDFNATLDHQQFRDLLGGDDGYVDAADAVGKGYDTTWPAGRDFPPEITIDHVLIDPRMRADDVSVHVVPRSDHRAVIARVRVPR